MARADKELYRSHLSFLIGFITELFPMAELGKLLAVIINLFPAMQATNPDDHHRKQGQEAARRVGAKHLEIQDLVAGRTLIIEMKARYYEEARTKAVLQFARQHGLESITELRAVLAEAGWPYIEPTYRKRVRKERRKAKGLRT